MNVAIAMRKVTGATAVNKGTKATGVSRVY